MKNTLLLGHGDYDEWTNEGFIAQFLQAGTDQDIFGGYTRAEEDVEDSIRERIVEVRARFEEDSEDLREIMRVMAGDDKVEKLYQKGLKEIQEVLSQFPEEDHERILDAHRFHCNRKLLLEEAETWSDEQWQEDMMYSVSGNSFDVSEVALHHDGTLSFPEETV